MPSPTVNRIAADQIRADTPGRRLAGDLIVAPEAKAPRATARTAADIAADIDRQDQP